MKQLEIKPINPKSVGVIFSPDGVLTISGVSCDEDPKPLYQQLKNWVAEYIANPAENTEFSIRLKYFNSSSAKCLFDLLESLNPIFHSGKALTIYWYYEEADEDMLDVITAFEDLIPAKIEKIKINSYSV
ncbi:MAG TPA: DUF1987 domain-containing protein [Cytophagaceae bacterium]|jgi:hypothetical protein|nr:DUF1987 domain-containing protein [Cytophagaceae bacterium]